MSIENHPNVHAVKLMLEVNSLLKSCLRGKAESQAKNIEFLLLKESRKFAEKMSEKIDEWVNESPSEKVEDVPTNNNN